MFVVAKLSDSHSRQLLLLRLISADVIPRELLSVGVDTAFHRRVVLLLVIEVVRGWVRRLRFLRLAAEG